MEDEKVEEIYEKSRLRIKFDGECVGEDILPLEVGIYDTPDGWLAYFKKSNLKVGSIFECAGKKFKVIENEYIKEGEYPDSYTFIAEEI